MAEIVLKIPEEFEQDFNADKFKECFERVLSDCKAWDSAGLSGNYEHETLEMLLNAFNEAVVLPKGHGALKDAYKLLETWYDDFCEFMTLTELDSMNNIIKNAPTVIEADKGDGGNDG